MNVLYSSLKLDVAASALKKLNKCFQFDTLVCVPKKKESDVVCIDHNNFVLLNHHEARHAASSRWSEIPPLSGEMIAALSFHKCIYYDLLNRQNKDSYYWKNERSLKEFQYWNYILDKFGIDLFICAAIPHTVVDYAIYALCKVKKIKTLLLKDTIIPGYMCCVDDIYDKFDKLENTYMELLKKNEPYDFSIFMQNYIAKMESDSFRFPKDENSPTENKKPKVFGKTSKAYWGKRYKRIRDFVQSKNLNRQYERVSIEADFAMRYIYVPLHFQPEMTTSPLGGVFVNQLLMVKIISWCAKDRGILLYVKEHPAQEFNYYKREKLYDDLLSLPNVRLIKKKTSSYKLQEHCVAVATVTGTVVMESLFKGKPALVFGHEMNSIAPNAYRVSDIHSCETALSDIVNKKFPISKEKREAFLKAVELECFRGYIGVPYGAIADIDADENVDNVFNVLKNKILEWKSNGKV